MTQWYVLQVLTGQEEDVQRELERHGYETLLLREMRTIRQRGSWREAEYLLMPGYLFVRLELTDEAYYLLNGTAGVIRILSTGGRPSPLEEHEANWLQILAEQLGRPSTIQFYDAHTYRVVDGALRSLERQITGIDRHRRRVRVMITSAGHPHRLSLSYCPIKVRERS